MRVRQAGVADVAAVLAIDSTVSDGSGRALYLETAIGQGHCWLALLDDHAAGFAIFAHSFFAQPFVELLITRHEYRRRGVGTALLRHIESLCMGGKLFTSTNASNEPMHRFCAVNGFARSGYVENLDEGDPEIIYAKHLSAGP